jgi:hypothetical protein
MSQKQEPPTEPPKRDYHVHADKSLKGHSYRFHDKHRNCSKTDHGCWLKEFTRPMEFALFQDAETGDYSDEKGNLYNVHRVDDEYIEIGTRKEQMAKFCNPDSNAEWHGFPIWPIKTREDLNRKSEGYRPSKLVLQKMVEKQRISKKAAFRLRRGDLI